MIVLIVTLGRLSSSSALNRPWLLVCAAAACTLSHSITTALAPAIPVPGFSSGVLPQFCSARLRAYQPPEYVARKWASRPEKRILGRCVGSLSISPTSEPLSKPAAASTARFVAVQAVYLAQAQSMVDQLDRLLPASFLDGRDRSFARLLVTTTERRLGQIDNIIAYCSSSSSNNNNSALTKIKRQSRTGPVDRFVQAVLRIGVCQIMFLEDIPLYAAVKETVDVLRKDASHKVDEKSNSNKKKRSIKVPETRVKYVNAVLRRLCREKDELRSGNLLDPNASLLQRYCHSPRDNAAPWLLREWDQQWGTQATDRIVALAMEESPRCLSIRQDRADSSLNEILKYFPPDAEVLPQGSIRLPTPPSAGPISQWPLYQQGEWWLQDVSATLPALLLHSALQREIQQGNEQMEGPQHRPVVVDLCAAPGGKTAQLSGFGCYDVVAIELSPKRARRLEENRQRLQMDWTMVIADGAAWTPSSRDRVQREASKRMMSVESHEFTEDAPRRSELEIFRENVVAVLLDAPCTATGTGSKRPDVLRRDANYTELLETQYRLMEHAIDNILPVGGILVYATCSLLQQESELQMKRILSERGPNSDQSLQASGCVESVPIMLDEIPWFSSCVDDSGWMRILPGSLANGLEKCDGFFVARLRRVT
jgi:16S rRNA (cytosine967-C5)-methyltransferase